MTSEQVGPVLARLAKEAAVMTFRDPERQRRICQLTEKLDQMFQKDFLLVGSFFRGSRRID